MIKIRRARRLVAVGADAAPAFEAPPAIKDLPDAAPDDLVARVVGVIEVPYLKPTARRRRRDRVDCRIAWPAKLEAAIGDQAEPIEAPRVGEPAVAVPLAPTASTTPGGQIAPAPSPTMQLVPTIVGAAAAACGYMIGKVAAGGPAVFAASLAVGLALLLTFVAVSAALRSSHRSGASTGRVAVITAALALTAVVTAHAGIVRAA